MTKMTKIVLGAVLSLGALAAAAPIASARSTGAFGGNPLDGTPWVCYKETAGAVASSLTSGCPSVPRWEVQLPVDRGGTFTIQFQTSNATCEAVVANQSGVLTGSTTPAGNTGLTTITSPSVPAGGYLFLACNLGASGGGAANVSSINWN